MPACDDENGRWVWTIGEMIGRVKPNYWEKACKESIALTIALFIHLEFSVRKCESVM